MQKFILIFTILCLCSCQKVSTDQFQLRIWQKEFPLQTSEQILNLEKKYFRSQLSILQNVTTSSETILTVLKNKTLNLEYQVYSLQGDFLDVNPNESTEVHPEYKIDQLLIQNLKSEQIYFLVILDSNHDIVDIRKFSTLPESKKSLRLAVASCARVGWMGGDYGPISVWDELKKESPDALIFLGDWVYPDNLFQALFFLKPSLEQIKDRYIESWLSLNFFRQSELTPTFSILDDHDYGFQGANRRNNFDRQNEMFKYYRAFFPVFKDDTLSFKLGPGASFWIKLFKLNLFMLDNKYFRTASGPEGVEGLIWGPEQLKWLEDTLIQSPLPSLIGSGSLMTFPIFNQDAAQYESPEEFSNLLRVLNKSSQSVILLSGDVHYSDVKKLPFEYLNRESYEITSSRVHSIHPSIIPPYITGFVGPKKGQLIHSSNKNFVMLDIPQDSTFRNTTVEIHNKNSREILKAQIFKEPPHILER